MGVVERLLRTGRPVMAPQTRLADCLQVSSPAEYREQNKLNTSHRLESQSTMRTVRIAEGQAEHGVYLRRAIAVARDTSVDRVKQRNTVAWIKSVKIDKNAPAEA